MNLLKDVSAPSGINIVEESEMEASDDPSGTEVIESSPSREDEVLSSPSGIELEGVVDGEGIS